MDQVDVPFLERYHWLNIDDVQVVHDELKLVVQGQWNERWNR